MKPLAEQDHYEVLETSRAASAAEIDRAYRLARATYAHDSLAGYSIFGEGDVEALRERIDAAYRVLSDEGARRAYDGFLAQESESGPPAGVAEPPAPAAPLPVDAFEEFDDEAGEYDGARLRRSRLRRGFELEQIASITKINPLYLRFLEEERFSDLPAAVYVRGFVSAYASCLALDPRRVASSYMKRFESHRPGTGQRRRR